MNVFGYPFSLIEKLLVDGLDDHTNANWVVAIAHRGLNVADTRDLRAIAIGLIAELLLEGLMVAGDLERDGHFYPWNLEPHAALRRIIDEWSEWGLEQSPTPGAVCWLDNTEKGDEVGRKAFEREKQRISKKSGNHGINRGSPGLKRCRVLASVTTPLER